MISPGHRIARPVGRQQELDRIHQALDLALAGKRQLLFLAGEPGIGKTTLVEHFVSEIESRSDIRIAAGQCVQHYGKGEAYLPLLHAMGHLLREFPELVESVRREAPSWLAQMPSLIDGDELDVLQRRLRGVTQERMIRELSVAIERMSEDQGFVLLLEDLHWSDVSTIDCLSNMVRRRSKSRLLILGTYRVAEARLRDHSLRKLINELRPRRLCAEIEIKALNEEAIGDYLKETFEVESLNEEIPVRIWQRTGGNPLFMVHLVDFLDQGKALVEKHHRLIIGEGLDLLDYGVPEDLRQLISEQVDRLSDDDLSLMEVCSVAGVEFSCKTVAAALGRPEAEVEERCQTFAKQLQFIEESGVEESPDGSLSGKYRFRHVLYQNVLYDGITEPKKVRIHRTIGEFRKGVFGESAGRIATELVSHFEASKDAQRTIEYYGLAGESALKRNATEEAIGHFQEALGLLPRLTDPAVRDELELRYCLAIGTSRMCSEGHTSPAVKEYYGRAIAIAERLNSAEELHLSYYGLHMYHFVSAHHQEALHLGRQCLANARKTNNSRLITEAYTAVGNVHTLCGDFKLAGEELEAGLAAFNEDSSGEMLFHSVQDSRMVCLSYLSRVYWYLGQPDKALELSEQCVEIGRGLRHPHSLCFALFFSVIVLFRRGEFQAAMARAAETVDYADEYQFPIWSNLGRVFQGIIAVHLGDEDWGIKLMLKGIEERKNAGALVGTCQTLCLLVEAYLISGHFDEGFQTVERALTLVETSKEHGYEAELVRQKGELILHTDDSESAASQAEGLFQEAIQIAHRQEARGWELRAATSLARLWQGQGRIGEAKEILSAAYEHFTEGFETGDVKTAVTLISDLGGATAQAGSQSGASVPVEEQSVLETVESFSPPQQNRFVLEGDFWSVSFANQVSHIKNSRGMEYLSVLLKNPNEEVHALRLVQGKVEVA